MVPYNPEKKPKLPQWSGGAMNAAIVLDQGDNFSYTNLDEISGRVIVRAAKSADVGQIVVKLEGESRTRLLSPPGQNGEKPRPQLEYHKILYQTKPVFPPVEAALRGSYTLPAGTHEYPFTFKLPFNNSCFSNSKAPTLNLAGLSVEMARAPANHVKKTLPPTLTGFPGEAEIRYFVKATVQRHSFFKENSRAIVPFNFLPVESPRPPTSRSEVYARLKHAFSPFNESEPSKSKMKGIFGSKPANTPTTSNEAPIVSVDARLPEPAILTCNDDIPLRILVKKLNDCAEVIYLQSLQVSLIGVTKIRAHEVFRDESNSWVIVSKSNMGVQIGSPNDSINTETVLDDRLWRGQPLPNTVAPSFETCNISRTYQLDVRIGLSYGDVHVAKPQNVALPLRLSVQIFSGIAPPASVLERMAQARASISNKASAAEAAVRPFADEFSPPTPTQMQRPEPESEKPAQSSSTQVSEAPPPNYSEAPPSYEDAVAQELPPIDGPRREYAPPAAAEDTLLNRDEKRGWVDQGRIGA